MAIRIAPRIGPELAYEHLFDGGFLPVCTPDFARTHGLDSRTEDLTGVPLFRFSPTAGDPAIVGWDELLARHGIRRDDDTPANRVGGVRVALSGQGLVLSSLLNALPELRSGRLVAPLGPRLHTRYTYGYRLVWSAGRSLTPAMRRFREWMRDERRDFLAVASALVGVELT